MAPSFAVRPKPRPIAAPPDGARGSAQAASLSLQSNGLPGQAGKFSAVESACADARSCAPAQREGGRLFQRARARRPRLTETVTLVAETKVPEADLEAESTDAEAEEFRAFLDAERVAHADRIVRRIALRGFAEDGLALARADLVPEVTITAEGVYWHPIGGEDSDLMVRSEIFPWPNPSRPCASPSSGKASTSAGWRKSSTARDAGWRRERQPQANRGQTLSRRSDRPTSGKTLLLRRGAQ